MNEEKKCSSPSRRRFLENTALAAVGLTILPSQVIGGLGHVAPSDKLNIAGIGIGGRGGADIKAMRSQNIVALCDVDWNYSKGMFDEFPNAKKYWDWRLMFDEMQKDIDAVVVGTSDHTHAIIAINAMKMGKHVYCEKPLTHSVWESRKMTEIAEQYRVATQMGNQGNSGEGLRQICEWIWDGAIGEVKEVHAWTDRPIWPQGLERPTETVKVPKTLNWDLFLGPAAERPFNPIYTPWNWRGWWDFGTGALGDMACHILDPVFKGLMLKYPSKVQGRSTQLNTESAPTAQVVTYTFPARPNLPKVAMPEVKVTWWDGGLMPPRPEELPEGFSMNINGGGCLFIGTKGKLLCGCYATQPMLLPKSLDENYVRPAQTLRRVPNGSEGHQMDWVRACKEDPSSRVEASSYFGYSGPMNEMVAMGVLAVRLQDLKRELLWDGENMRFTNISETDKLKVVSSDKFHIIDGHPHFDTQYVTFDAKSTAEEYIKHTYRKGWEMNI